MANRKMNMFLHCMVDKIQLKDNPTSWLKIRYSIPVIQL